MKRKLALAMAFVLTFGLLAGCGNKNQGNQGNQGAQSNQSPPGGSQQQPPASSGSDTLVVYTARSESLNNAVIENFEADTGIRVEVVTGGTGGSSPRRPTPRATSAGRLTALSSGAMWTTLSSTSPLRTPT